MNLPKNCVVDTNVPKIANLALSSETIPEELFDCVTSCIEAINHVTNKRCLVIDDKDEIFDEYRRQLCLSGRPGIGDSFIKWVHDHRWGLPNSSRVQITQSGDSYNEFPDHEGLKSFDKSDRKFVAVANAHPEKPPILQAADSKWWGWRKSLDECGIKVVFLCKAYVEKKYTEKMLHE